MDISKDIRKAIESQLPKEVGDVLSERLARLEELEESNEQYKEKVKKLQTDLSNSNSKLQEHKELDDRERAINDRETEVSERESKMDVHDAQLKAEEAEKRALQAKEYVSLVFRSPVYRKTVSKSVAVPNDHYMSSEHDTEETTVE